MRILMVAARCYPFMGGIETHIQEVGPRLVARGHAVDVLTTDPSGDLPAETEVRGMRVRRVLAPHLTQRTARPCDFTKRRSRRFRICRRTLKRSPPQWTSASRYALHCSIWGALRI